MTANLASTLPFLFAGPILCLAILLSAAATSRDTSASADPASFVHARARVCSTRRLTSGVMRIDSVGIRKRPKLDSDSDDVANGHDDYQNHAKDALAQIEQGLLCGICIELYDRPCVYVLRH